MVPKKLVNTLLLIERDATRAALLAAWSNKADADRPLWEKLLPGSSGADEPFTLIPLSEVIDQANMRPGSWGMIGDSLGLPLITAWNSGCVSGDEAYALDFIALTQHFLNGIRESNRYADPCNPDTAVTPLVVRQRQTCQILGVTYIIVGVIDEGATLDEVDRILVVPACMIDPNR